MIIRSRAPVRISFGGGGTDLAPYCNIYGGVVLSATINKYVYVTVIPNDTKSIKITSVDYKKSLTFGNLKDIKFDGDIDLIKAVILRMKPDFGFDITLRSDVPPNTGLGSSGAVAVAIIGAFNHCRTDNKLHKNEIAELAYKIESEDLKNVGGRQDQYSAVFGGINYMEFWKDDCVKVVPIKINQDYILELEKHLILTYVGDRGPSGEVQEIMVDQQINDSITGSNIKTKILDELKANCNRMFQALSKGELDFFGNLLHESWKQKKKLSSMITSSQINKTYNIAFKSGALGGKITGAGGGGCMIFFSKSNKEHLIVDSLTKLGTQVIDFSFDMHGLVTWELEKKNRSLK